MKRLTSLLLAIGLCLSLLAGCNSNDKNNTSTNTDAPGESAKSVSGAAADASGTATTNNVDAEIVDGRFVKKRKITVEVYDRSNDGGTPPDTNVFAEYIKEGMLRDHNIEVEFQTVPRWTEIEVLNNLLAAGDAPDVCVTYSYPTIQTYASMGGVMDLAPLLEEHYDLIPDLVDTVKEDNLYHDLDPTTGQLWAIEGRLYSWSGQKTYVREDWLKKLNMDSPTTFAEYEAMLYAFKDNAELLLGEDADQIIPFYTSEDVGWYALDLADSIVPGDLTDKELYVYSYDDRRLLFPNYKEVIRILNKWYNDGLIWKDFSLYTAGDQTGTNLIKAGYVGTYCQNSDDAYRNGEDGIMQTMQRLVGPEAAFDTIQTFENEDGVYKRYQSPPIDRKVFFPSTNKEPVASLMYLNWISKVEPRTYLQTGEEGINHELQEDGSYKMLAATGDYIFNSPNNLDYTIVNNGLNLGSEELTMNTLATSYAGIDPSYIIKAFSHDAYDSYVIKKTYLGEVKAEEGVGTALTEKRNTILNKAVVAPVNQFDAVFDQGMQEYLDAGGQAIMDERTALWESTYGDKEMLDE